MADTDLGPLDKLYVEKNKLLLIVLSVIPCTSGIMFVLSLICFFTAKSSESKGIAKLMLMIALAIMAVVFVLYLILFVFAVAFGRGG